MLTAAQTARPRHRSPIAKVLLSMTDFWIPLLGSALGGAIVTSIFGLVKTSQDKSNENAQWLRNQKIDVYTNLLRQVHASSRSLDHFRATGGSLDQDLSDISDITNARLLLVGSRAVRQEANCALTVIELAGTSDNINDPAKFEAWQRRRGEAYSALEVAIRKDLGTEETIQIPMKSRYWSVVYFFTDPFHKWYFRKYGVAWVTKHPTRAMRKQMR